MSAPRTVHLDLRPASRAPGRQEPTRPGPYVRAVLIAYHALPDTPRRTARYDRLLAASLATSGVPLDTVKAAFLLATARRTFRSHSAIPLGPIRSLAYFLPVLDEVLALAPDPAYLAYLHRKLTSLQDTHSA